MTNKQRILDMVQKWPEDISFKEAVYQLYVLQAVMEGLKDVEEGRVRDFDEVFDELEQLSHEEESQVAVVAQSNKGPKGNSGTNNGGRRAKNGRIVYQPTKKVRKPAS